MLAVIKREGLIRILLIFLQVIIIISFMDAATMFFSQGQSREFFNKTSFFAEIISGNEFPQNLFFRFDPTFSFNVFFRDFLI